MSEVTDDLKKPKTEQQNWLAVLLDAVKSDNKYRNGFIIYWIIWNYDFVLVLLGKSSILDKIREYYHYTYPNWLSNKYDLMKSFCGTFLTHDIIMPLLLAFVMPTVFNFFNYINSIKNILFEKFGTDTIEKRNEELKKEVENLNSQIKDLNSKNEKIIQKMQEDKDKQTKYMLQIFKILSDKQVEKIFYLLDHQDRESTYHQINMLSLNTDEDIKNSPVLNQFLHTHIFVLMFYNPEGDIESYRIALVDKIKEEYKKLHSPNATKS